MKLWREKRGVALMLVLSAITVLTMMAVEFAYNTSIYYNLAQNEADRLKAYYLAKSAYNFMQLELKFDKAFQQVVKSQNLGEFLGQNAQLPLCQQFPISTGLIRAVFAGGMLPGMEGEEVPEELEEMRKDASISQEKQAQEFLSFEGDFDGECQDEGTKIDLNGFVAQVPEQTAAQPAEGTVSAFDRYKQFLFRFLSDQRFELLFEKAGVRPLEVVNAIGDWVDSNSDADAFEGRTAGSETAAYQKAGVPYQVRNGRLITLMEAYLIDGVLDDWFAPMMEYFTVYGGAGINVCAADEEIVAGLIKAYIDANPGLPPVRLEDEEEMGKLTSAVATACASGKSGDELKGEMDTAMGLAVGELSGSQAGQGAAQVPFSSFVSTGSDVFSLKLAGQVGDITVRIKAVVDTSGGDPGKWVLRYWRVY